MRKASVQRNSNAESQRLNCVAIRPAFWTPDIPIRRPAQRESPAPGPGKGDVGIEGQEVGELSPPDKVFAFDASKLNAPDVTFWTAWQDDVLLGCAALKELSSAEGEIKSMRTPSMRRRTGAGRALLNHIIDVARTRAYQVLYLETGCDHAFVPAQTLYRSAGFAVCGPFGPYRENGNSAFMSLKLA